MTPLLQIKGVSKSFPLGGGKRVDALRGLSLELAQGEILGVVGESGCGKSTLARTIMGIHPPDAGEILYRGAPLWLRTARERLDFAKCAQMVFQDPYTSLDPRMSAGESIAEGLRIHLKCDRQTREARVVELLALVGLPGEAASRFPHEFSGGQRQRIGIARALAVEPELLICDEPISALDLSVQSQIVNLLRRLREQLGLSYLFIAHDLNMVRHLSDRIAVMYAGSVVELAEAERLVTAPQHPYTQVLLDAVLVPDPDAKALDRRPPPWRGQLSGQGCAFAGRCPIERECCHLHAPELRQIASGHLVACHIT